MNTDKEAKNNDLYMVPTNLNFEAKGSVVSKGDIKSGMIIEISFSGEIMEVHPAQLKDPVSYRIVDKGDNLIEMYIDVFESLIKEDTALNDDTSIMAFDFSKTTDITTPEKNAIAYVLGNEHKMETIQGTYEELCNEGYIDKENLYFKNGFLLKIEVKETSDKKLVFEASKWRSGLGAIGMTDCKATNKNGTWTWKRGGFWIS